ncbi:hypothetical protein C0J52_07401 [Blattella germanica]|nr:hypothetical protein C0J52_07401 [Blattella germanica]
MRTKDPRGPGQLPERLFSAASVSLINVSSSTGSSVVVAEDDAAALAVLRAGLRTGEVPALPALVEGNARRTTVEGFCVESASAAFVTSSELSHFNVFLLRFAVALVPSLSPSLFTAVSSIASSSFLCWEPFFNCCTLPLPTPILLLVVSDEATSNFRFLRCNVVVTVFEAERVKESEDDDEEEAALDLKHIAFINILPRDGTQVKDAATAAQVTKWRWAGHVVRLNTNRWTKIATVWDPREGERGPGRRRMRWADELKRNGGNIWIRIARNRDAWKAHEQTRQEKTRQDSIKHDQTRRAETRQDKKRQDKIGQDMTRQDKTRKERKKRTRQEKTR